MSRRVLLASLSLLAAAALGVEARQSGGGEARTPAEPEARPLVQSFVDGYIDWGAGVAAAWGRAPETAVPAPIRNQIRIRRVAEVRAKARLLAIVQSVRATSEIRVGDRPDVVEKVTGILQGATIVKERTGRKGFLEVLVEAPLHGVQGISYVVFETMLPPPRGDSGPGGPPPADQSAAQGAPQVPTAEVPPDQPTGIVIDARGTGLEPALLPRILEESGEIVSSPETVDREALEQRGMAAYGTVPESVFLWRNRIGDHPLWVRAVSLEAPGTRGAPGAALAVELVSITPHLAALAQTGKAQPAAPITNPRLKPPPPADPNTDPLAVRRGPRPYRLKAGSAAGALKADVVLSQADADRLENLPNGANLLKECRVLVIVESPVGGVEGVRGRTAPRPPAQADGGAVRRPWPARG